MTAFRDVLEARLSRRDRLRGAGALSLFAGLSACATGARGTAPALTFTPIGPSAADGLRVPPEYEATVLLRWGDPVGAAAGMPEFRLDASNSAADQAPRAGMHHDGMHFFPLAGASGSARGLLVMNHEYLDEGLHTTPDNRTAFVNIQHPGEVAGDRSNPDAPRALSNWPDYRPDGRPRSATVVIRRRDGGVIGT